jgi:RimK family alpha-L-glutamate ligase
MKVAIISVTNHREINKIHKEAIKLKHQACIIHPGDIVFHSKKGKLTATHNNKNLLFYDAFIFHGLSTRKDPVGFFSEKSMLSHLMRGKGKLIVEPTRVHGKVWQYNQLASANLPIPKTIYARNNSKMLDQIKFLKRPYIVKPLYGSKGKGVTKFENQKDLRKYIKTKKHDSVLIQEAAPGYDHRIIVVGNKVLGVMKKHPPKNDFRANISTGGKGEKIPTTKEFVKLALEACRATKTFFGGVDIMKSGNKYTILEVNRAPQFDGPIFEDVMKINVARELILGIAKKIKK